MTFLQQLAIMPRYRANGNEYSSLSEAATALGSITVNTKHSLVRRPGVGVHSHNNLDKVYRARSLQLQAGTYTRSTLACEIEGVPPPVSSAIQALYPVKCGGEAIDADDLADRALAAFADHVGEFWRPDVKHAVLFSSGYDSRLVGGVLKKLADKKGMDWLGDVKFCCFQPEIDYAKTIFDYLGFPENMWHPIDPGAPSTDYYADCLDFATVGAQLSESERFSGGPLLAQLRLGDYLDGDVQGLSAVFSDETGKWNRLRWGDVGWFVGCYLFDNPGIFPGRPNAEFLFPFASLGWLKLVTKYRIPCDLDDFKLTMNRRLDPNLADLDALPNYRFQIGPIRKQLGGHIHQQVLSKQTVDHMEADYAASWYAQSVGPRVLDFSDQMFRYFAERNGHYIKAAIYQHLIDAGVTVNLE